MKYDMIHISSLLCFILMPSPDVLFIMWTYWINPLIWEKLFLCMWLSFKYIKWIHIVTFKHNENFRSNFVPSGGESRKVFPITHCVLWREEEHLQLSLWFNSDASNTYWYMWEKAGKQATWTTVISLWSCHVVLQLSGQSADGCEKDPLHYYDLT